MLIFRPYLLSLTFLLSLTAYQPVRADQYQSWVGEFDANKHCNISEIHNQRQGAGYDNHATVNETNITHTEHHSSQVTGSNTGWESSNVDLIRQQDCSAVIQSEAYRYATYQQTQTAREINDTQLRQSFLGNMLAW
ncbi:hypothetical protein VB715_17550 [Crocosphaera sp. UHCC 0190]|uniref:hypothetical protein n=1 Tax=Crocosphaera sp. UHCC 0190 TaxID=3110246 RepID=UPI002B2034C0|nr:hypothetical protein [Crocosphaera sp. UHCC 0190]MEA5511582.1 hypothetical protein [Crocosphaera sp. UHCC 0190]